MTRPPVIDAWVNLNSPEVAESWDSRFDTSTLVRMFHRSIDIMTKGQTIEQLVESMDEHGVSAALVTTLPLLHDYGSFEGVCEPIREATQRFPTRFSGLPMLDPTDPVEAAKNLEYAISLGFKGARIMPALVNLPPNDRRYYPTYMKALELDAVITINVGMPGPVAPAAVQRPIHLDDVCRDFPELRIVATHMGHPWHTELISLMSKYPNLHLMTSAWAPRHYPREIIDFMNTRGQNQVMFATDYPLITFDRLNELNDLAIRPEVLPKFLAENAASVFRLDPVASRSA